MSAITQNLQAVQQRILAAQQQGGFCSEKLRLIAVSKTFPAADVLEAMAAGQIDFGENYVQEALDKMRLVRDFLSNASQPASPLPSLRRPIWHFIGPIQSNKTRSIAEHFDWVHGVDRLKIAQRLSEQRPAHLEPLKVLIQVNISNEATKSGVAPSEVQALAQAMARLPHLTFSGLMAIPEPAANSEQQRLPFAALRKLAAQLNAAGLPCPELSMGMSADLEAAIFEGATLVRVGTAIFGQRRRDGLNTNTEHHQT